MSKRTVLILILLAEAVLLFFGYNYWQDQNRIYQLLSEIEEPLGVNPQIDFPPAFPTSFAEVEDAYTLSAVSTGETSFTDLKSSETGDAIARAGVLEVVAVNGSGRAKKLNLAVQLFPASDPERNLIPWVSGSAETLSAGELAASFPEGRYLIFALLTDPEMEEAQESLTEYMSYARRYYGGAPEKLRKFLENNLSGWFNDPILVLDILEP